MGITSQRGDAKKREINRQGKSRVEGCDTISINQLAIKLNANVAKVEALLPIL